MRRRSPVKWKVWCKPASRVDEEHGAELQGSLGLQVVVLYEDAVTLQWANELWHRVDHLVSLGENCRRAWRINDLARTDAYADAVQAATNAHVLVISFRDAGDLPPRFSEWVEAWVPHRNASGGAMVALIGVQTLPHSVVGQAYGYLKSVALRAGMDFLPHERKLPALSAHQATAEQTMRAANPPVPAPTAFSLADRL
jgi:hypothetical protein